MQRRTRTAYIGQVLSVVADGVATAYTIQNADGDLAPLALPQLILRPIPK